jgi:hypothetical protein
MAKSANVTLAFICPFQKHVIKNSTGFYCNKCAAPIANYTNNSPIEPCNDRPIGQPSICGAFKKSQLSDHFLKYATATLILTASISFVSFGQEKTKILPESTKDSAGTADEDVVFGMFVEVGAEPIGGYSKFFEALAKELNYPSRITSTGKCFVEVTIDTTGATKDYKILRGVDPQVDQEVIRALQTLSYPWKPARLGNKAITSRYVIPIIFDKLRK